jgi:enamine deaminase RidA (YjgF/YER057c/UK114 family)
MSAVPAERRLSELNFALPPPPTPFVAYVETVKIGNLLFLSGMLPKLRRFPALSAVIGAARRRQCNRICE